MKPAKANAKAKWYSRMTPAELDGIAATFDREIDYAETKPLTPAMRKAERAARRKRPGRPKVGLGAEKLRISMEKGLLKQVDAYAKEHGLTRSDLIAQSLRRILKAG
jgi:hypothetical protein